jgi:periplasmic protein CpxP/Spy
MFTSKTILTALAATFALAAPSIASAGKGKGHRFDVCAAVECTDSQAQKVDGLREAMKATVAPIREKAKAVRAELHAEMAKDKPDASKVERLRAEMQTLRAQKKEHFKGYMTDVKAVLTPEQVAKLEQMKSERRKNFEGKKGKGKKGKGKSRS